MTGAAIAALTVSVAAPGQASPDDVTRTEIELIRIYDNALLNNAPDWVVIVGATAADICAGLDDGDIPASTVTRVVHAQGDVPEAGSSDRYSITATVPVELYRYKKGDVFDFFERRCGNLPRPRATGDGHFREWGTSVYDGETGVRDEQNSVCGTLTGRNGRPVHVRAYAKSTLYVTDPATDAEVEEQDVEQLLVQVWKGTR
ncbi:hypothetical protein [Demequina phytophila]|uniref:hypothetical protein n=1 Tax=Demequina phytophila TaxID=1638981 RepID=UPI0012DFF69A|nr:hypothetical protein [Demequina phytophila]